MDLVVDLTVEKGGFYTIFGPSGAGKSTILRMVSGLTDPDEGTIRVQDQVWFDSRRKINLDPGQRGVGMVFQDYALFPTMSVRKNLLYALDRKSSPEQKEFLEELLSITGLRPIQDRLPGEISGGQKQRVALARALVRRPEILLLDEPLSALDTSMRKKLQDLIIQLQQKLNVTTLLVSHDITEVFRTSSQVVMMDHGRIVRKGSPAELFLDQRISGKFRFTGEVLAVDQEEILYTVSVMIGNTVVKLIAMEEEAEGLSPGDTVLVASKAMNPVILKATSPFQGEQNNSPLQSM